MLQRFSHPLFAALSICLLAGCAPEGGGAENSSEEEAGDTQEGPSEDANEALLMADTAWLSVGSDGSVQTTFLDADGQYRDFRNGVAADTGSWESRLDGSLCLTPAVGRGDCWTSEKLEDDGSTILTSAGGKRVEIKQITYTAPPVLDEDTEESS